MNGKNWFLQNSANGITVLGLVLAIWLLMIAIYNPEQVELITALAVIVGITDFLDGKIARHFNCKSTFGGALDRLRDKVFIVPGLIILTWNFKDTLNDLNGILATLTKALVASLVLIEFLLFIAWWIGLFKKMSNSKVSIESNNNGKKKMFFGFFVIIFWLASLTAQKYIQFPFFKLSVYLIDLTLILSVYFAVRSLEGYYQRYTQSSE